VKDRPASRIVLDALRDGRLTGGRTLLDASSGNTGVAYSMLGAALGFPVELCVPRNVSPERLQRMLAYGARLVFTDPLEGTDGAQREARRRATEDPERYFLADQYNNPSNPRAHEEGTGPEIWRQTSHRLTHFVAGVGTGGTLCGTARYLKSRDPTIRIVGVEPDGPMHGLEGLKHMPTAMRPGIYDASLVDETVRVATEDAQAMVRRLAAEEGVLVGSSGGAAVVGALQVAGHLRNAIVVTLLPDRGERQLDQG
ncbi:MAG: cysteine synthase family protein, partial [Thermoplasmata archaeon]